MKQLLFAVVSACALTACSSSPSISPQGQMALEISTRIAVRHALADSPRAIEKARNIRAMAEHLKAIATENVTVGTLAAEIGEEIDKLELDEITRADAHDLLRLLAAMLEQRVGSGELMPDGVVKVAEFADFILSALPAV